MTIPQQPQDPATPMPSPIAAWPASGRPLAGAVAMFLGGYLLLASFAGSQLPTVAMNLFSALVDRPAMVIPESYVALMVLQFVFALAAVLGGIFLVRGPATNTLIAVIVVVGGALLTLAMMGLRLSGFFELRPPASVIFAAVFTNGWFAVVLVVGVAWLLIRRAGTGWLALLGTLLLVPIPTMLSYSGIDSGITALVMYGLSGIVGATIIAAGRPWQD
jgi:hypothetical protein